MRKLLLVSFLIAQQGYAASFDYVKAYRQGGMQAIEKQIQQELISHEYWLESLKDTDVRLGYYESVEFVFVANKQNSTLKLFENKDNKLQETFSLNSLMGLKPGDKMVEGDLKTPIGSYDLTAKLTKLDQFYGPLAYVTSYPNTYDKVQEKTGYGIWIHGLPLNGDREINTRGCIAIDNNILSDIDKLINHKKTILITADGTPPEITKSQIATLLTSLFVWRKAWEENNLQNYINFYDKDNFKRFDRMDFNDFIDYKKRIFSKNEKKIIIFSDINISPYPNEKGELLFKISFHEQYRASGGYRFEGNKELYVKLYDENMKILAEK